jgi:transposase
MSNMPGRGNKYSDRIRERAVRLVRERIDGDDRTDWQHLLSVAETIGVSADTVRRWVRQAEVEAGERPAPTASPAEVIELRRRNAELEQTVEILNAAASFFARECDPRPAPSASSSTSSENGSESHRSVER